MPIETTYKVYPYKELVNKSFGYFEDPPSKSLIEGKAGFLLFDQRFARIIGSNPYIECIGEDATQPFAHEAGVYIPRTGDVFITSNHIQKDGKKRVDISRVTRRKDDIVNSNNKRGSHYEVHPVSAEPEIILANGGVNYEDGILFCEQGSLIESGGLTYMEITSDDTTKKYTTKKILSNYYGRWFNSVNDVIVANDGTIWFTDPPYGHEQGIRPIPQLPPQTYCFNPSTGNVRVVDDSLRKPNGLCFSPDQKTLYITDTASVRGDTNCPGVYTSAGPASIYAFDVITRNGNYFLVNKRLLAYADNGVPDGIKCDNLGNVYSGCGDGVHVWAVDGILLGKIYIEGGCANFCFGKEGEMFLLNEGKMWRAQLDTNLRGDLLRM